MLQHKQAFRLAVCFQSVYYLPGIVLNRKLQQQITFAELSTIILGRSVHFLSVPRNQVESFCRIYIYIAGFMANTGTQAVKAMLFFVMAGTALCQTRATIGVARLHQTPS